MSSHPYVTQQNTPLADDTTLMSTTDLQSYITHANDTFVQVSGFTLQELQGQPHNMVRHPDMPKAAFADMWFTLKKGEPWSGIVKNRRKNGDHYWVRANAVPMVREGKISGYMSIRTRATDELNLITQKNAELVEESAQVSAMVKHRASRLEDAVTVLH
ncbi:TPA: PAS domain-containing protein [Escherichia coli]|nr:PAS domain-containing protein [Escherichia coli]